MQSAEAQSDSRLAVEQYLWPYDVCDVIDILKDFLKQISDSKTSNTQQGVISSHPLSNATFKLLDKKSYPEKSGF